MTSAPGAGFFEAIDKDTERASVELRRGLHVLERGPAFG
jgi:hypothetical protein